MPGFDEFFNQIMQRQSTPQPSMFDQARQLAEGVLQHQKSQRAAPFIQAIQGYGDQYAQAPDDNARQQANMAANAARAAFLESGGSPFDISRNLWGSSPAAGFQTGGEEFKPAYTGDNLTYGQREKLSEMKRKAMESVLKQREFEEADLPMKQAQTAYYQRQANAPYGGGGSSGGNAVSNGGLTPNQAYDKALEAAKADEGRLSNTGYYHKDPETGAEYFTLPQLIDAYYRRFTGQEGSPSSSAPANQEIVGFVAQAKAAGRSNERIIQYLKLRGVQNPESYL